MGDNINLSRRELLPFLAGISLLTQPAAAAIITGQSDTLVAYHSRSGNTRVIAGILQRALQADLHDLSEIKRYKTIYLGYPIWGMSLPSIVRSFLTRHDFSGMTIVPFITHGGYGIGDSLAVLEKSAPGAHLLAPFMMQADQERQTMEKTLDWLVAAQHKS